MTLRKPCLRSLLFHAGLLALLASAPGLKAQGTTVDEPLAQPQAASDQEIAAVLTYWTPDVLASALPAPAPDLSDTSRPVPNLPGSTIEVRLPSTGPATGNPTPTPTTPPTFDPGAFKQAARDTEPDLAGAEDDFGTFPFSFTRYRLFPDNVPTYTTFPHVTVGKLFFVIPGRGNFVCSASSLNSNNLSVVWTAGHCVFTRGIGWHNNFLFVPARRAGANPLGVWTTRMAWTLVGWTNGWLEYDMGALVANRGGLFNQRIVTAVGGLGFMANASRQQHWHLQGYPAAPRPLFPATPPGAQFDGEHQELCAATWAVNDLGANGPQTMGVGCDKTGGTSGGPWTVDFNSAAGPSNYLNSNNSYRYLGGAPNFLRLYGPYFTTGAINLRNAAQAVPVP
jgi:V8-like Glu-specific endopeptidase